MLLPIPLPRSPMPRPTELSVDSSGDAPVRPRDCVNALLLFAVVTMAALVVLGADWAAMTAEDGVRPLPEATRMMIIAPLPR